MAVDMSTRNDRIKAFLKTGKTIAEAATKFDLSKARIWKVAHNFKEAPRSAKTSAKAKAHGKATKKVTRKVVTKGAAKKALGISKAQSARKAKPAAKIAAPKAAAAPATKLSDDAAKVQA